MARKERKTIDRERAAAQLGNLMARRQRILDSYFEGVISPTERDVRPAEIEPDRKIASDLLARQPATFDVEKLAQVFRSFVAFDELKRDQKRRLLNSITPEIIIKDYVIDGLSIGTGGSHAAMAYAKDERIYLPLGINLRAA
jgi:hypothetical protein